MITILYVILIAIIVNIDSFVSGFTYGIKNIKIKFFTMVFMAILTTFFSYLGINGSKLLDSFILFNNPHFIGALIFLALGLYYIIKSFFKKGELSEKTIEYYSGMDFDRSKSLNIFEAFVLTIALSIDTISASLGAGLNTFDVKLLPCIFGIIQLISLDLGIYIGNGCSKKALELLNQKLIDVLPGLIFVFIGISGMF